MRFHPHQDVSSDLEGQTNKPTSSTNIVGVSILLHEGHAHNPTPHPKNKWAACICKDKKNSTIFGGTKMLTKIVCVRERERKNLR
jgi:coproporphyrinogen III oxidase